MNILAPLNAEQFLTDIWQQRCHVFRQVIDTSEALVDGDELAALACDTQVESRFIFTNPEQSSWKAESGAFAEDRFENLPDSHWTLMVQSVDHWVPELHELLNQFSFLPRWRLDDILATYACDGGGVGPHFDYYDVFLIQAQGRRKWRIGQQCSEQTALQNNNDVKLLANFEQSQEFVLEEGDMLYIPPKLAHWGSAIGDDCVTLSVGFRAPSEAELCQALAVKRPQASEDIRYQDTLAAIDANPHRINAAALQNVANIVGKEATSENLTHAFASMVSEPFNLSIIHSDDDIIDGDAFTELLNTSSEIVISLDAACRCAFIQNETDSCLYLNGEGFNVSHEFALQFCALKLQTSILESQRHQQLLLMWLAQGYIYLEE